MVLIISFYSIERNYRVVVRKGHFNNKLEFELQDHKIPAGDFGKSLITLEL